LTVKLSGCIYLPPNVSPKLARIASLEKIEWTGNISLLSEYCDHDEGFMPRLFLVKYLEMGAGGVIVETYCRKIRKKAFILHW
jgi:hypothetical protein